MTQHSTDPADVVEYDSPNGVDVTLGPVDVIAGSTFFSVIMLQTAGGGTDTYSTTRVNIVP